MELKIIFFIILILLLAVRAAVILWSRNLIKPLSDLETYEMGIVFGAGLEKSGIPSKVLLERIQSAVMLYQTGKISKVLMTGDNRDIYYNEPAAMKMAAQSLGIHESDILTDPDGHRSIDSCRNAIEKFNIHQAILITQPFHLPRVLWTARKVGIQAIGFAADHEVHRIDDVIWWHIREIPATFKAIIEGNIYQFRNRTNKKIAETGEKEKTK